MRHIPSRVGPAARRGLCAAVLLALLALLHVPFAPAASPLPALDLDGCSQPRATGTGVPSAPAPTVPSTTAFTGAGGEGHQDDDTSRSCAASAYGRRQLAGASHALVSLITAPDGRSLPVREPVQGAERACVPPLPPVGPVVLRC